MYIVSRYYTQLPGNKGRLRCPTQAPAGSRYFSQETVPVQGGYGALFASLGINFLAYTGVAVQG